jgi:hypothetical protein
MKPKSEVKIRNQPVVGVVVVGVSSFLLSCWLCLLILNPLSFLVGVHQCATATVTQKRWRAKEGRGEAGEDRGGLGAGRERRHGGGKGGVAAWVRERRRGGRRGGLRWRPERRTARSGSRARRLGIGLAGGERRVGAFFFYSFDWYGTWPPGYRSHLL